MVPARWTTIQNSPDHPTDLGARDRATNEERAQKAHTQCEPVATHSGREMTGLQRANIARIAGKPIKSQRNLIHAKSKKNRCKSSVAIGIMPID